MTSALYSVGLRELNAETGRQFDDARNSFYEVENQARAAAERLRGLGDKADGIAALAKDCVGAGCEPIILDFNGGPEVPGCVLVSMPYTRDLGSTVTGLVTLQRVVINAAGLMVDDLGQPVRSTKVSSGERGL